MPEIIRLNDGTEYNGSIMYTEEALWLFLPAGQLAPYFEKLNNPENTATITHINWGKETVYSGYNHLYWIKEEPNKMVSVGLKIV